MKSRLTASFARRLSLAAFAVVAGCASPTIVHRTSVDMGDAYAGMGQYELAVQNYRRAATEAPENPLPLYRLGMLYLKRNEIPNAQESFENCLNLQPDYFLAQVGLIRCALNAGDYRKAHLLLGQIPEERRGGGDVLFLQGMLYFYLNDFDRARAMFSEAVKVDPLHTEAKRMLETLPE